MSAARVTADGLAVVLLAMLCSGKAPGQKDGLSKQDLAAVAQSLPEGAQVTDMRLFYGSRPNALSVAVQADYQRGWSIFVFSPGRGHRWEIEWKSTRLTDSFAVASTDGLLTRDLGGEQGLVFSGCAAHQCSDVFSALLYVPSRRKAFAGTCASGHTTYSFAEEGGTQAYRTALDDVLQHHPGSDTACSQPPVKKPEDVR